jgi:hypothetical protein
MQMTKTDIKDLRATVDRGLADLVRDSLRAHPGVTSWDILRCVVRQACKQLPGFRWVGLMGINRELDREQRERARYCVTSIDQVGQSIDHAPRRTDWKNIREVKP